MNLQSHGAVATLGRVPFFVQVVVAHCDLIGKLTKKMGLKETSFTMFHQRIPSDKTPKKNTLLREGVADNFKFAGIMSHETCYLFDVLETHIETTHSIHSL